MARASERVTFRGVLAIGEFRALWLAELLSIAGDQLARVALAVLVYQRTGSATLTGLTYALTFVPALVGGIVLAGLGDRFPRREVLVAADLARAVLVGLMAVPGIPFAPLCVLVAAVSLLDGPFKAAQQALLPDVLPGPTYTVGMALRAITSQSAQLVGFAGGGALISAVNPSVGLTLNAVTFVLSAVVVRLGVRHHDPPAEASPAHGRESLASSTAAGARLVWRDPRLRSLLALCWLAGFYIAPEAIAAPYAAGIGAGAAAVGLLMAADPAGSVLGGIVAGRLIPVHIQARIIGLLGVLAGLPLIVCVLHPGLVISVVLFALSGMLATIYTVQGVSLYTRRLPDAMRSQGAGLLSSGLKTVQGLGALLAGILTDQIGPANTVAVAGAAGALVAVPIAVGWNRAQRLGSEATG